MTPFVYTSMSRVELQSHRLRRGASAVLNPLLAPRSVIEVEPMTLSVRSRFEVFKRDGFTCGYCGRTPDDEGVKLEVDHITPRAAGGTDDITNLVTSCWECNSGKSSKDLQDKAPSLTQAMANTRERALQLAEYRRWQSELDEVSDDLVTRIWDQWIESFGGTKVSDDKGTTWSVDGIGVPSREALMRHVDEGLEVATILRAIEKVHRRWSVGDRGDIPELPSGDVLRYFFGTLKRIREEGGRADCDGACGYPNGRKNGVAIENERIRELFVNHEANGYATYADVVAALWPED